MTARFKIYLILFFAALIGMLFYFFTERTKELVATNVLFLKKITLLEKMGIQLRDEILKNSFLAYQSYDKIQEINRNIENELNEFKSDNDIFQAAEHARTVELLHKYELIFLENEMNVQKFLTLNSIIKNSSTYIPTLVLKHKGILKGAGEGYLEEILNGTSQLFLDQGIHEAYFLKRIEESVENMRKRKAANEETALFNSAYLAHAGIFIRYFEEYSQIQDKLLENTTADILEEAKANFIGEHESEVFQFTIVSIVIFASFLLAILFVVYSLAKADKENIKLLVLQKELRDSAMTDQLTKLPNRFCFEVEHREIYQKPVMLLVNIDGFKHINDFYGTKVGDFVLKKMAEFLKNAVEKKENARVYRLGADDFGILLEDIKGVYVEEMVKLLIEKVEQNVISYQNNELSLTVSVGISREEPLIEKADMVLKHIKVGARRKFLEFREELDLYQGIHDNLHYLSLLKGAIHRDDILPYFQPIFNNLTGKREKFECLARIIDEQGNVLTPLPFLNAAKKSKLYAEITRIMILKSFIAFGDNEHDFSINLSIEDILDKEMSDFVLEMLDNFTGIGKRLVFEILESEGISNYKKVNGFISKMREYGCRFALDDFGAGHSNFEHVLELDFDYLKIDSSLIKNIDTDRNSAIIVETIVDFARKIGDKKITAEFVHTKTIHEKIKALGIDYSQGYYLGRPLPEIV